MKNFIVCNAQKSKKSRYTLDKTETLLKAQIENSLELGWKPEDFIVLANFKYEFMGVKTTKVPLNKICLTGSKVFGLRWLFENWNVDDVIWAHDMDAWQNVEMECPEFNEIGATYYSRPKFNGGSIFWKPSAKDVIEGICSHIEENEYQREEPTLDLFFKKTFKERVTVINESYNLGCSGYVPRYQRSIKPIRVCHFHPYNRIAWETHALDRNGLGETGVSKRLETLLRKYYKLATELSSEGKKAQKYKIKERKKKEKKRKKSK